MSDDKLIPVKVAVRIRPLSKKESNEGCQTVVEVVEMGNDAQCQY